MKCLIVSGGSVEDDFALACLTHGGFDLLVAADKGVEFFYRNRIVPDLIVGDFDSVSQEALDAFRNHTDNAIGRETLEDFQNRQDVVIEWMHLDSVKDDTDTESAIRASIAKGATEIVLLGGTGTRIDHVLGNISLLGIGLEEGVTITLLDPHNRMRMFDRSFTIRWDEQFGRYLSLFPYGGMVRGVTLTGVKYPLRDYDMGGYNSLGVSNEITGEEARVDFRDGVLVVVESRD